MPLVIKQVVVKTTISEDQGDPLGEQPSGNEDNVDLIVSECVDRVLEILKEEKER